MHTNEPRELEGVELGYDPRDIDSRGIYKVIVYFFVFTLIFFGGGYLVFVWRGWGAHTEMDPRKSAFSGPRVQGNITSKVDIMTMRQNERATMETYGTNPDGKQRIPVDRAIELLAERGLPVVTSDQAAQSKGNTIEQNATGPAPSGTTTTPAVTGTTDAPPGTPAPTSPATPTEPTPGAPRGAGATPSTTP